MDYRIARTLVLTMLVPLADRVRTLVADLAKGQEAEITRFILEFLSREVTPERTYEFETQLSDKLREAGRRLVEATYNELESDRVRSLPHDVVYEGQGYRRLNETTVNAHAGTLFGTIQLQRVGYRPWERESGECVLFPVEVQLGLVEGATPALAERVGAYMASAGATQRTVLERLRQEHGIAWGAERLRSLTRQLALTIGPLSRGEQVSHLRELLKQAFATRGRGRPSLAVGRDGVTLQEYRYRFYENATVATISVYDRSGKRLGTFYLAQAPELGQGTMTENLKALILELLESWDGPLPQLAYVTDAGEHETQFYTKVLRRMRHPRTGELLPWTRILDYYHASQRLWTIAELLFGPDTPEGRAWARRMCHLLKESNGPSRVLHSAGALLATRRLTKRQSAEYGRATNYLRQRTREMQYHEFKKRRLPIGSGVTEAACKTVVTQRLKLSGMRWSRSGAQPILDLRVLLLSHIWHAAYRRHLKELGNRKIETYGEYSVENIEIAA